MHNRKKEFSTIPSNMKPRSIFIVFALFLTASVVFLGCGKGGGETTEQNQKKLPLIKFKEVVPEQFNDNFKVMGVIKPFTSAKVSSEEGGLITYLSKDKGSPVSKGEIVARIKKDVELASLEQTEAQVELARMNYEKQKQLYEDNATTEIQYLTAKWQYEAAIRGADILKQRLKTGYVRSPISGVIDDKFMNRGEMSAPGSPIFNIIDISTVKVSAGVPEMYLTKVTKGQSVNVTIDVLPGVQFEGKVNYISPALQGTSRTFEIEILINNKERLLKPGMNANVVLSEFSMESAVVVPQDLIVDYGDVQYVFVLEGDIARKRELKLGGRNGNQVLIESGLNPGDKLITDGFQSLKDGDKVQVVQ
ncbi:MAG: efflux RND transporter periplasmic adaptor subunit [Ignavibacteria bacterium]|nr:efflux RND transporter periplasmic adaptor subunit [Ignavibacteria bacterium]